MQLTDRELTKIGDKIQSLPPLSELISETHQDVIKYINEKNSDNQGKIIEIIGHKLWFEEDMAVGLFFMPKGCVFSRHDHISKETLIIYRGKLQFFNGSYQGKIVNAGEVVVIDSEVSHRIKALEETALIGITVPADEGYPK